MLKKNETNLCNAITLTDNQSPEVFNLPFLANPSKVRYQILVLSGPCYPA